MGKIVPSKQSLVACIRKRQVNQCIRIAFGGWVEVIIKKTRRAEKSTYLAAKELNIRKESA